MRGQQSVEALPLRMDAANCIKLAKDGHPNQNRSSKASRRSERSSPIKQIRSRVAAAMYLLQCSKRYGRQTPSWPKRGVPRKSHLARLRQRSRMVLCTLSQALCEPIWTLRPNGSLFHSPECIHHSAVAEGAREDDAPDERGGLSHTEVSRAGTSRLSRAPRRFKGKRIVDPNKVTKPMLFPVHKLETAR